MNSPSSMKNNTLTIASIILILGFGVIAQTLRPKPAGVAKSAVDRRVIPDEPAPALPPAGGTFVDSSFGTTIMRVTDEKDGKSCTNFYSYWPSFNLDTTLFFIGCDGNAKLYRFDPNAFRVVSK